MWEQTVKKDENEIEKLKKVRKEKVEMHTTRREEIQRNMMNKRIAFIIYNFSKKNTKI